MFFALSQAYERTYKNYKMMTNFQVPFSGNSQWYYTVNDGENRRQYHHFYNASSGIIDPTLTLLNENAQYYVRVHKDHEECVITQGDDVSADQFLPDLNDYTYMGKDRVDGRLMEHYRLIDTYNASADSSATYAGVANYQHEFYCIDDGVNCVPQRWEIHGRSNFNSHQDYYILEFFNFSTDISGEEKLFEVPMICNSNTAVRSSEQRESPVSVLRQIKNAHYNLGLINRINSNPQFTFKAAPNRFLHKSHKQLLKQYTGRSYQSNKIVREHDPDLEECQEEITAVPKHIDWRIKGAVGYVKDQVFCGSCWTFAAAGMLESRMNIMQMKESPNAPKISLSEQSIVDCFWDDHEADPFLRSSGCEGGQ